MSIITISREFSSGGRELGKRLSDVLGYDYYDREIISAIAQERGLDENYVENVLENHSWTGFPLTFRHSFSIGAVMQRPQTNIIAEQRRVIESIGKAGKDCIIVGRNADIFLEEYHPFNLFVCADMQSRIHRCRERAADDEHLTDKDIEQNIRRIDKNRAQTREMITGQKWGDRGSYHLIVNTSGWVIKDLAPAVVDFVQRWFRR